MRSSQPRGGRARATGSRVPAARAEAGRGRGAAGSQGQAGPGAGWSADTLSGSLSVSFRTLSYPGVPGKLDPVGVILVDSDQNQGFANG
jgi:hypothetical protein